MHTKVFIGYCQRSCVDFIPSSILHQQNKAFSLTKYFSFAKVLFEKLCKIFNKNNTNSCQYCYCLKTSKTVQGNVVQAQVIILTERWILVIFIKRHRCHAKLMEMMVNEFIEYWVTNVRRLIDASFRVYQTTSSKTEFSYVPIFHVISLYLDLRFWQRFFPTWLLCKYEQNNYLVSTQLVPL